MALSDRWGCMAQARATMAHAEMTGLRCNTKKFAHFKIGEKLSHPYFKNKIGCIKDSYVPQE